MSKKSHCVVFGFLICGCAGPAGFNADDRDDTITLYGSAEGLEDFAEDRVWFMTTSGDSLYQRSLDLSLDPWRVDFTIPRRYWKRGLTGWSTTFVGMYPRTSGSHIGITPFDAACLEARTDDRYECRWTQGLDGQFPPYNWVTAPADEHIQESLIDVGFYFHACTHDFLPMGLNRRSYCDRPDMTITRTDGTETKRIAYYRDHHELLGFKKLQFKGDGASVAAAYDVFDDGQWPNGRPLKLHRGYYLRATRDTQGSTLQRGSGSPPWEEAHLVDIGECSIAVPWESVMPVVIPNLKADLVAEIEGDPAIRWVRIDDLRITVPPQSQWGSAPDKPIMNNRSMLVYINLEAKVPLSRVRLNAVAHINLGFRNNQFLADVYFFDIQYLDGIGPAEVLEPLIRRIIEGQDFSQNLTAAVQPFVAPYENLGLNKPVLNYPTRAVSSLDALHVVLQEDGSGSEYLKFAFAGLCQPSTERWTGRNGTLQRIWQ